MRQHPPVFWLALLLILPLATPGSDTSQVPLQANEGIHLQEPTKSPEQNKASVATLDEAAQLTRTVVKLFDEKKYNEALPLAKRALALREAAFGADHELVQNALFNLAETYTVLKKSGEALKLIERLVKTHETKFGPEDAGLAMFLDRLAYLEFTQRNFDKAEAAYQRALAIREKAYGPNHAEVATTLYSLAQLYRYRGKLDKAQPIFEQAVILRGKLLGYTHPDFLKAKEQYMCTVYEGQRENRTEILIEFAKKLGDESKLPESDVVLNGRALSMPRPAYPVEARNGRAQGVVVVRVTIDELGKVIEAADMCGANPLLVGAALEAARKARFTPTKISGQPIKVRGVVTYDFVIQ